MSVQFGTCNFDGKPVDPQDLDQVRHVLAPYGPDSEGFICKDNFGILYRAFHTTKEARRETQPHISKSGSIITWDGRLDNRQALIGELAINLSQEATDLEIVAAGYERWGSDAFRKFVGDWALSIWTSLDRSLILAKDFVGTRHLYYTVEKDKVTWCTVLDPLVLFAGHPFRLQEEYIAGWLAFFPAPHLTPYVGIQSVPPSSFVHFAKGMQRVKKYWDFNPAAKVRHRSDGEYEEHFRVVFSESVRRRLRSDTPVLAELSGGVDSSSIVCMADEILSGGLADTPRLDTLSYYDDSEPNWNERPYFSRVEKKRGRTGSHVDASSWESVDFGLRSNRLVLTPAHRNGSSKVVKQSSECMKMNGNRVVLSGIGGDEFMGGVPTPMPEIADLLVGGRLGTLARQLKVWALSKRKPWFHLLFEAMQEFLPSAMIRVPKHLQPAPWLHAGLAKRQRLGLMGYRRRIHVRGALPSFQESIATVDVVRRQLACHPLAVEQPCEERYPFLDRDLLEFVLSVPRDQLLRPGQRRSLMRRALTGIAPEEVLNRKRKAFVTRSPIKGIGMDPSGLADLQRHMVCRLFNFVDSERFCDALADAIHGKQIHVVSAMRTLALEYWLRNLGNHGAVIPPTSSLPGSGIFREEEFQVRIEKSPTG